VRSIALAFCTGITLASNLATLAIQSVSAAPLRPINEVRAKSAGIHKITGRHLTLYTDVPPSPEIDRLPAVFAAAVPQWAAYFGIPESKTAGWHVQGYLIADRRRFDALGLMPAGNDTFINGISLGSELWLYDQPTDYYRRHLLLHEGTHVFMATFLGSCGPGWYMEGTAELFATHRLDDRTGHLTLRIMPRNREEVPMLGRIKLIKDARQAGRTLTLPDVMRIDNRRQLGNEAYAWCWAAAKFLDTHPRYRDRFRKLKDHVLEPNFNARMRRRFADWRGVSSEWQAFVAAIEHDYDFERTAIDFKPGKPLGEEPHKITLAADRGWQSSGAALQAGRSYRLAATGRYQIATEEIGGAVRSWPCEPGGVTLEYYDGQPLGILLAAIDTTLGKPFAVGLGTTFKPAASGTLYFRVNDSAGKLDDNRGNLSVSIEETRN
jgi:hypothetical protein